MPVLLILLFPFFEIAFVVFLSGKIGLLHAALAVIAGSMFGGFLLSQVGRAFLQDLPRMQQPGAAPSGRKPMFFVAGLLFLFPGLLSDIMGVFFLLAGLFPPLGRWLFRPVVRTMGSGSVFVFRSGGFRAGGFPDGPGFPGGESHSRPEMRDVTPGQEIIDLLPDSKEPKS